MGWRTWKHILFLRQLARKCILYLRATNWVLMVKSLCLIGARKVLVDCRQFPVNILNRRRSTDIPDRLALLLVVAVVLK